MNNDMAPRLFGSQSDAIRKVCLDDGQFGAARAFIPLLSYANWQNFVVAGLGIA